jgi:hypothetical protein
MADVAAFGCLLYTYLLLQGQSCWLCWWGWWQAYDVWTGHLHSKLSGHYDTVNCCAFHVNDQV